MSSEPLLDHIPIMRREQDGAIITQFDYPTCETLGLLKMDFLGLRNLTVIDDAIHNIEANRGETIAIEALPLDDAEHLRSARPRRHARRVPARRRPDALAAAPDGARPHSRTSPPSSRCTGPGRWPPTRTSTTPTARTAANRSPDPPRARRAAGRDPRRDLRPGRLPGAGAGDRPQGRRLHAGPGRPAAPRDGQEEEGRAGRPAENFTAGMQANGFTEARSRRCGTPCCRSATTASTSRTPPATAWSRTGRPTSRRTTRPSTWPRC